MGQFLPGIPGLLRKGGRGREEGVEEPIHWSLNSLFLLPSFPGCQNSCCCWKTLFLVQQPFCRSNTCVGGIFHTQPHPHTHTPRRCFLISQSTRPNSFLDPPSLSAGDVASSTGSKVQNFVAAVFCLSGGRPLAAGDADMENGQSLPKDFSFLLPLPHTSAAGAGEEGVS